MLGQRRIDRLHLVDQFRRLHLASHAVRSFAPATPPSTPLSAGSGGGASSFPWAICLGMTFGANNLPFAKMVASTGKLRGSQGRNVSEESALFDGRLCLFRDPLVPGRTCPGHFRPARPHPYYIVLRYKVQDRTRLCRLCTSAGECRRKVGHLQGKSVTISPAPLLSWLWKR